MKALVWSLLFAATVAGIIAATTHANMADSAGQMAIVAIFVFIFLLIGVPVFLAAGKRARAGRVAALLADGFASSHVVQLGSVELLFDSAREEWALVDRRQTERFSYDQFDRCEWDYDASRNGALKIRCKVMTYDPARPYFQWMAGGRAADGERWSQRITAVLNS